MLTDDHVEKASTKRKGNKGRQKNFRGSHAKLIWISPPSLGRRLSRTGQLVEAYTILYPPHCRQSLQGERILNQKIVL